MSRPRIIDRNRILDAAEAVVSRRGASALSFATVAEEAGLSKATVQSVFGTRAKLIETLIDRWAEQENRRFAKALGGEDTPQTRLAAHLDGALADMLGDTGHRIATLLAVLTGEAEQSQSLRAWYATRLEGLTAETDADRQRRICYLAAEGAFFLRCLVGLDPGEARWREIFADFDHLRWR